MNDSGDIVVLVIGQNTSSLENAIARMNAIISNVTISNGDTVTEKIRECRFTLDLPPDYDILPTSDDGRDNYRKVTAPPPPWKRR